MFVIETFEPSCQPRYRPNAPPMAIRIDPSKRGVPHPHCQVDSSLVIGWQRWCSIAHMLFSPPLVRQVTLMSVESKPINRIGRRNQLRHIISRRVHARLPALKSP
jgi:hypothetical protein